MYIDCPTCGQTEHESKFRTCGRCGQYICKWCRDNSHGCKDVYSDEDELEQVPLSFYNTSEEYNKMISNAYEECKKNKQKNPELLKDQK